MPVIEGSLQKMTAELDARGLVHYKMAVGDQREPLNPSIGKRISLVFDGRIHCIHCGRKTNKSFNQGYCFPCFKKLAQCDRCIMSPELCHFDAGTCREPDWAQQFCMTDHIVYLANASGLKVGITRVNQVPTRWIDQGAVAAVPLYRVASRKISGLIETAAKAHVADKTNWRAMLKNDQPDIALADKAQWIRSLLKDAVARLQNELGIQAVTEVEADEQRLEFPVRTYPKKIVSLNPEKTPEIGGMLEGIRGQYLLLDSGVINLRKYTGYQVAFQVES